MISRILFVCCVIQVAKGIHPIHTADNNRRHIWGNIWTTIAPPITVKPRSRNILDSIKAVTDALKRVTENKYRQKIVSTLPRQLRAFPTRQSFQSSLVTDQSRQSNTLNDQAHDSLGSWTNPTAQTRFDRGRSGSLGLVSSKGGAAHADRGGIVVHSRRSYSHGIQSGNNGGQGLNEETSMLDPRSRSNKQFDTFALQGNRVERPIALYALDPHHHLSTAANRQQTRPTLQTATNRQQTRPTLQTAANRQQTRPTLQTSTKTQNRSRFRFLPDGSIVDFGLRIRNEEIHNLRQQTSRHVAPTVQTRTRQVSAPIWSSAASIEVHTKESVPINQALSTSGGQTVINTNPTGTPGTSSLASIPITHFPTQSSAASSNTSPRNRVRLRNTGFPVRAMIAIDDSVSSIVDDPSRRGTQTIDDSRKHKSTSYPVEIPLPVKIPLLPLQSNIFTTAVAGLNFTVEPTSTTTRRRISSTTLWVTTTTLAPTTTTTRSTTPAPTTTPKPTQHPDDARFYSQGGAPINITTLNDNHVCPKSRARWQDYTVYLETKARLCMIQITFHARYKREPIYTDTWWSNTVDYVYKTVYDPEIKMVDLHTWPGSTWYG